MTVPANTSATVYVPAKSAAQTFVATGSGDAKYLRYEDGYQVYDVGSGDVTFLQGTSAELPVGGTVPATLSLSLGAPATFGAFAPGVDRTYDASTTANVISTAGDATLSVDGRPPDQRHVHPERAAPGLVLEVDLDGTGVQRPREHRLPPAHRPHRAAAHRELQQDADVHAVDDDTVETRRPRRAAGSPELSASGSGR